MTTALHISVRLDCSLLWGPFELHTEIEWRGLTVRRRISGARSRFGGYGAFWHRRRK
jgi:hypothetical protein